MTGVPCTRHRWDRGRSRFQWGGDDGHRRCLATIFAPSGRGLSLPRASDTPTDLPPLPKEPQVNRPTAITSDGGPRPRTPPRVLLRLIPPDSGALALLPVPGTASAEPSVQLMGAVRTLRNPVVPIAVISVALGPLGCGLRATILGGHRLRDRSMRCRPWRLPKRAGSG